MAKKLTKKERQEVFDKFGGHCAYCGDPLEKGWHVDHREPIGRRTMWSTTKRRYVYTSICDHPERDTIENFMPACRSCNINKHDMSVEEFRYFVQNFIKSLNRDNVPYKIAKRFGLVLETEIPVIFFFETYETD